MAKEYKIAFFNNDNALQLQQIELQALSAQNAADLVRKVYGGNVSIVEISEIKYDWK